MNAENTFGKKLKGIRKAQGLSQKDVAERLGFAGYQAYARYETQDHAPKGETLQKLAAALDVPDGALDFKISDGLTERQAIVTWHEPGDGTPIPEDVILYVTVSGRMNNITCKRTPAIATYFGGEGWLFEGIDPEESDKYLTVDAWCDLEPYGGTTE